MTIGTPVPRHEEPAGRADAEPASRTVGVIVVAAVVLITLLLGAVLVQAQRPEAGLAGDPIGAVAPDFTLATLDGGVLALEDLRGGPVLLTFWASWCTTCKADVPKFRRIVEDWQPAGVTVVGIVIDDSLTAATAAADEAELSYPSVFDAEGTVRDAYGVRGTPETFLLDADGRVTARWIGPLPAHEAELQLAAVTGGS
jgi:peroxiredoxin